MAAGFHIFPHVAVFLLLSTVVGEGDVSRKGECGSCGKNGPGNHTLTPNQLRIIDGGPFFPHDPNLLCNHTA